MKLAEYFEKTNGVGILSTADEKGKVNAAIYGRPHFMDENTVAFISSDRLTHANLKKIPPQYISLKRKVLTKDAGFI